MQLGALTLLLSLAGSNSPIMNFSGKTVVFSAESKTLPEKQKSLVILLSLLIFYSVRNVRLPVFDDLFDVCFIQILLGCTTNPR